MKQLIALSILFAVSHAQATTFQYPDRTKAHVGDCDVYCSGTVYIADGNYKQFPYVIGTEQPISICSDLAKKTYDCEIVVPNKNKKYANAWVWGDEGDKFAPVTKKCKVRFQ